MANANSNESSHPAADGTRYNVYEELCMLFVLFRTNFCTEPSSFEFLLRYDLPVFLETQAKCTFISVNISWQRGSLYFLTESRNRRLCKYRI